MKIFRAVITGTINTKKGRACQDYADYMRTKDGFLAAALSDGAGGADFSDLGAKENVNAFFNYVRRYDVKSTITMRDKPIAEDIIKFCKDALSGIAKRLNIKIKELSATFLGLIVTDDSVVVCHLGDGAAFVQKTDGSVECVSKPDNIFGIINRTHFTTDDDAVKHMRITRLSRSDIRAAFIMSDGVFECLHQEKEALIFAKETFQKLNEGAIYDNMCLSELIDGDRVREKGDDHSMILIELGE